MISSAGARSMHAQTRSTRLVLGATAVLAVLAAGACSPVRPLAARVASAGQVETIDRADFNRELAALRNNPRLASLLTRQGVTAGLSGTGLKSIDAHVAARWLTAVIYQELARAEFIRRRLTVRPADIEAAKAQLGDQFGGEAVSAAFPAWFRDKVIDRNAHLVALRNALAGVDPSEAGERAWYDSHQSDFSQLCLSHILVKTIAEADDVEAKLKAGQDFAALARARSVDAGSAPKGGDLGCSPSGAFIPEFAAAAATLGPGGISAPVHTEFGYHVILERERRQESFDDARPDVQRALAAQVQAAFTAFITKATLEATVTVDPRYGNFTRQLPSGQLPKVLAPLAPHPSEARKGGGSADAGFPGQGTEEPSPVGGG